MSRVMPSPGGSGLLLDGDGRFPALPTPVRARADPRVRGRGVTLAQVDAGFYPHPDLVEPRNRSRAWADVSRPAIRERFIDAGWPARWPGWNARRARDWHGLMTTAVAAGNGRLSQGLYRGVASEADLVLVRAADRGSRIDNDSLRRALEWIRRAAADLGIRVVNFSVGGEPLEPGARDHVSDLIADLADAGIVVVAAAGNAGHDRLVAPARAAGAITVGGVDDDNALDHDRRRLWHGNYGVASDGEPKPDLVAPSIWLAAPMLPDTEVAEESARLFESRQTGASRGARMAELKLVAPGYQHVDGTSFASAIVASVACCVLEVNPALTPEQVRRILVSACDPIEGAPRERQGAGVIDAGRAVALAREM